MPASTRRTIDQILRDRRATPPRGRLRRLWDDYWFEVVNVLAWLLGIAAVLAVFALMLAFVLSGN